MSEGMSEIETKEPPERRNRLSGLIQESRRSLIDSDLSRQVRDRLHNEVELIEEEDEQAEARQSMRESVQRRMTVFQQQDPSRLVEVRLQNLSYHVPIRMLAPSVKTVLNQSICYGVYEFFHRVGLYCKRGRHAESPGSPSGKRSSMWLPRTASDIINPFDSKPILNDINLVLKPGTTYLVLGPPGCGKTSLLKAIAGRLPNHVPKKKGADPPKGRAFQTGRVEYNGVAAEDEPNMIVPNICSFVGQLDDHAAYLTVRETFEFAFQCRTGGKLDQMGIRDSQLPSGSERKNFSENLTIDGMDLTQCADTFVGDSNVRGISGGQRRRVTVGEMMQGANPVACADEFSTGLDAAVTYDIAFSIVQFAKAAKTTRVVSLLQPGPETFSLFDEVIVLSEGKVIYAGPIDDVVEYFASLGYIQPEQMDVADFLQSIPTPDGALLFDPSKSPSDEHYTSEEFAEAFKQSETYELIIRDLNTSSRHSWVSKSTNGTTDEEEAGDKLSPDVPDAYKQPWQNSFWRSTTLNFRRNFTLWKRDKGFIIGKMFENIGMAVATGGILFGQARLPAISDEDSPDEVSDKYYRLQAGIYGALFMTCFHILLGTMTSTPDEIDTRSIHYKQYDAKFYQVYTFVIGRFLSTIPQRTLEIVSFGIPLYFLVGFALSAGAFFIYLCLLIVYTIGLKMFFGILAQVLPRKANVQGVGTFVVLLATLFGGFIVYPNAIPGYYQWIYWANPMAWALQGLASNEFTSSKYDDIYLDGATFLSSRGFQTGREWIGYSFAYLIPFTFFFCVVLGIVLKYVRIEPEQAQIKKTKTVAIGKIAEKASDEDMNIPFTPVDLTFEKLVYEVKASTGDETLKLLNEVSGAFVAGRMCALMGSSGAGKTTLMDVIAMRKTSGTITGDIQLNGFDQDKTSFLRCSGYVEQFDVQQAELTVRETVTFCARLRLDASDPAIANDVGKLRYVDHVLETMELCDIENLQVGSYEEGGLTFEQRKRLAIACEMAGSPSVIFLDEPTSGLDSRGALVVIRAMRRIADSGRTVCATIHQPSAAVFDLFDDLLLLKRGGNTVFFGELGEGSSKLIEYFESRGAPAIEYGENPAAWMLRCMSNEGTEEGDWEEVFKVSDQYASLQEQIDTIKESADESMKISFDKEFASKYGERQKLMNQRIVTIYKRSPAYNLTRLMIAIFYAFLIGSVFIRSRKGSDHVWLENEVDGIISTMFLSLIIMGVTSISMAVPVMKKIRDVFYKHRASGMISHNSLSWSLQVGETIYLCLIAVLFGAVYYLTVGLFGGTIGKFGIFWAFTILNLANYTYFGQAFICLVKDVPTAGALMGALIGYNVFFSGLIVKPQYFSGPFQMGLWTAPGRFAFEGITMSQFSGVTATVLAEPSSPYFFSLGCDQAMADAGEPCYGTMDDYVLFYFGGKFKPSNFWLDIGVLLGYLFLARFLTWFSLKKFNYVNT